MTGPPKKNEGRDVDLFNVYFYVSTILFLWLMEKELSLWRWEMEQQNVWMCWEHSSFMTWIKKNKTHQDLIGQGGCLIKLTKWCDPFNGERFLKNKR